VPKNFYFGERKNTLSSVYCNTFNVTVHGYCIWISLLRIQCGNDFLIINSNRDPVQSVRTAIYTVPYSNFGNVVRFWKIQSPPRWFSRSSGMCYRFTTPPTVSVTINCNMSKSHARRVIIRLISLSLTGNIFTSNRVFFDVPKNFYFGERKNTLSSVYCNTFNVTVHGYCIWISLLRIQCGNDFLIINSNRDPIQSVRTAIYTVPYSNFRNVVRFWKIQSPPSWLSRSSGMCYRFTTPTTVCVAINCNMGKSQTGRVIIRLRSLSLASNIFTIFFNVPKYLYFGER